MIAPHFSWQGKDWLDQPLHFSAGAGATLLIMMLLPALVAFLIVLSFAAWREYKQHPEVIFDLDLLFVFLGVVFAIFVTFI
ncbi:hypothetical protein [Nitrosovibrio sp. Nv6]|uniref:hypothetical protein n=1 Tax=Nitrosovibrio sp. Nv6 TaxID=1855340 RepID=UPI0008AE831A|nr:hypothetical protein [Nitrosovibrio sp. Nv6]SEO77320.1 hypothetical protein SAMN05216316_1053 [Nitrosovibrio sp. Nv6]